MVEIQILVQRLGAWSLTVALLGGLAAVPAQAQSAGSIPEVSPVLELNWDRAQDPDFPEVFSQEWMEQFGHYICQFLAALSASGGTQIPHASSGLSSALGLQSLGREQFEPLAVVVHGGLLRLEPGQRARLQPQWREALVKAGAEDVSKSEAGEIFTRLVLTLFNQPALQAPSFFQSGARLLKFLLQTLSANDIDVTLGPAETKPSDNSKEPNPAQDAVLGNVISVIVQFFGDLPEIYISDI